MANEFRYGLDQNGVRHPVCDDTRVDWASYAVLGAKNQIPSMSVSSYTESGITFTRKEDLSIELNGTSTAEINYDYVNNDMGLQALRGDWVARLGVESISGMNLVLYKSTSGSWNLAGANLSQAVSLTDAEHLSGRLRLYVANNKTFDHVVIKPTLYLATDSDTTYTPYAMTNKELTERVVISGNVPPTSDDIDYTHTESTTEISPNPGRTFILKMGKLRILSFYISSVSITSGAWKELFRTSVLPDMSGASANSYEICGACAVYESSKSVPLRIAHDGKVSIISHEALSNVTVSGTLVYLAK